MRTLDRTEQAGATPIPARPGMGLTPTARPAVATMLSSIPGTDRAQPHPADALDAYKDLFRSAGVALAVLDRSGTIQEANNEFLGLTERPAENLVGLPFWALVRTDLGAALRSAFAELTAGVNRLSSDAVLPRPGRTALRCRITVTRIAARGRVPAGALLSLTAPRQVRNDVCRELRPVEREVLRLVAAGATTTSVAVATHLSRQGVDYNLRTLMERFSAQNRTELVARAFAAGVLAVGSWPPRLTDDPESSAGRADSAVRRATTDRVAG